jgi:tripartite-type tricarboxylate transporter receptor subunit TctC
MHQVLRTLCGVILGTAAFAAVAQSSYPERPIRMIVPLGAASAVDNAARILTKKMATNMGQAFIVENQPGAAGQMGADRVAKAVPDGYTIGAFNDSIMTMLPNIQTNLPWNILKDFEPVSLVATVEWGLVSTGDGPLKTIGDVIKAAKANPGKINYGSGGIGSPQHIAMELFSSAAGVKMTHVPYKGAAQAAVGVAGNEVALAFEGLATVTSLVQSKRLTLVAVSTKAPLPQYPGVPTVSASGLPGFEFNSWFTIMVPKGTPKPIIDKLNAEIVKALKDPEVIEQFRSQGLTPRGSSPQELATATREQLARYAALIKSAGITAE